MSWNCPMRSIFPKGTPAYCRKYGTNLTLILPHLKDKRQFQCDKLNSCSLIKNFYKSQWATISSDFARNYNSSVSLNKNESSLHKQN